MIRRPPRSTLFPTRRSSDLDPAARGAGGEAVDRVGVAAAVAGALGRARPERVRAGSGTRLGTRSEEHTSELQSHVNLVCRLLLEKKKKKKTVTSIYHINYSD